MCTGSEFGYNEHSAITSRFLCIRIIDSNVKKFGYNEHPPATTSFFCIFLLVVSRTQCPELGAQTLLVASTSYFCPSRTV